MYLIPSQIGHFRTSCDEKAHRALRASALLGSCFGALKRSSARPDGTGRPPTICLSPDLALSSLKSRTRVTREQVTAASWLVTAAFNACQQAGQPPTRHASPEESRVKRRWLQTAQPDAARGAAQKRPRRLLSWHRDLACTPIGRHASQRSNSLVQTGRSQPGTTWPVVSMFSAGLDLSVTDSQELVLRLSRCIIASLHGCKTAQLLLGAARFTYCAVKEQGSEQFPRSNAIGIDPWTKDQSHSTR